MSMHNFTSSADARRLSWGARAEGFSLCCWRDRGGAEQQMCCSRRGSFKLSPETGLTIKHTIRTSLVQYGDLVGGGDKAEYL